MKHLSVLLLAVALTGCGDSAAPPDGADSPPAATTGAMLSADSGAGSFEARVVPQVEKIPLNEPFAVRLSLIDPLTGDALTEYDEVTIDARMPAHQHGMLRDVELVPQDDGTLLAEGLLFHMVGHWEIHVDVRRGARVERAQVDVQLEF